MFKMFGNDQKSSEMFRNAWKCSDMYTNVCSDLASFGYVVFALEHECGSAAYAKQVYWI